MSELTYTRCGDYYNPDLKLSEQPEAPIGKYGRMRRRYLETETIKCTVCFLLVYFFSRS